jgi:hypothetical protein
MVGRSRHDEGMAPAGKLKAMRVLSIAAMALLANIAQAQSQPHNAPVLEKLCGKLLHSEQVPVKNTTNTFEDKTKNLSHVMVQLYRADDRPCCDGLFLAAEAKTGRWGSFHLKEKGLAPGLYWVVARPNSREYRMLVRYEPKSGSEQLCSQSLFELNDAGNFWRAEIVVLD